MSWTRIQGHDHLKQSFAHVVRRHRLAHAYLFVGPAGVGKKLFAQELGKTLLCENPRDSFEECDTCDACLLVQANTHPDFFLVGKPEDKNEFPIELMREVCQNFSLKTARGHGKVAILEDADDLNDESTNCFLKTLEEPPPGSVVILIGSGVERQYPTILSRCQIVRFGPLPPETVANLLHRNGIESALLPRVVALADGSPGQGLALADPSLWDFRKQLLEGLCRPKPDTVALAKAWIEFVEEAGKEAAPQRKRAALILHLLLAFFREALPVALGAPNSANDPDERRLLNALVSRLGPDQILTILDRGLEAEAHLDRYIQVSLVLEAVLDSFGQTLDA